MENVVNIVRPEKESELELKPCPFCGSNEIVYMQYEHTAGLRWQVFCCGCAASIDPGYAQSMHVVKEMWNKRVKQGE